MLQASGFDRDVHVGANAIRVLRWHLPEMGFPRIADGVIRPRMVLAARRAAAAVPGRLADACGIARRNRHHALADARPARRRFARRRGSGRHGWFRRAEEFVSAPDRLTEAEHRARLSRWG
jgi:hypothetical protein